jgi:hypothetical protein
MRKLAVALAAALATACGDPLLFAELEIPSVRVTLPSQSFPGTVAGPDNQCLDAGGNVVASCIRQAFTYDLGAQVSVLNEDNVKPEVRLSELSIALTATCDPLLPTCVASFATVTQVAIWILGPAGSGLPDVVVAEYRRSAANPAPAAIAVSGYSNVDLGRYVDAGVLSVAAEMKYDAATPAFTADVTGDFYLKVQLDYGAYLGL